MSTSASQRRSAYLVWLISICSALAGPVEGPGSNLWIHLVEDATGVQPLPNGTSAVVWGFPDGGLRLCDSNGILSELKHPLPAGTRVAAIHKVNELSTTGNGSLLYALTKEGANWGLRRMADDGELGPVIQGPTVHDIEEPEVALSYLWDGRVVAQFWGGKASKPIRDSVIIFDPTLSRPKISTSSPNEPQPHERPVLLGDGETILLATWPSGGFWVGDPQSSPNGIWVIDHTGQCRQIEVGKPRTTKRLKPTGISFLCPGRGCSALLYSLHDPTQVWRLSTNGTPDAEPLLSSISELLPAGDGRHVWIRIGHPTYDFGLLDTTLTGPNAFITLPTQKKLSWLSRVQDTASARLFAVANGENGVYRIDTSNTGPPKMRSFLGTERISEVIAVKGMPKRFAAIAEDGGGFFLFDRDGNIIPPKGMSDKERFLPGTEVIDLAVSESGERLWATNNELGQNRAINIYDLDSSGTILGKWRYDKVSPISLRPYVEITPDRKANSLWIADNSRIGYYDGSSGAHVLWEPGYQVERCPSSRPGFAWARGGDAFGRSARPVIWLIGAGLAAQPSINLRFGTEEALVHHQAGQLGHSIKVDSVSHAQLALVWPDRNKAVALNGKVSLYISDAKGNNIRERGIIAFRKTEGVEEFSLDSPGAQTAIGTFTVRLVYDDDSKTHFECEWPNVNFVPVVIQPSLLEKFLRDSRGQAIVLWLLVLALIFAVQHPRSNPAMRRFGPASVVMVATLGSRVAPEGFKPDPLLAGGLIATTVIFATVFGLFQPQMLRRLSAIFPFDLAVPIGLGWGRLRLRVFAPYLRELLYKLRDDRKGAQWERYIDLPVRVRATSVATGEKGHAGELLQGPASALAARLVDRENGNDVLIVAPGGHGKSALLRRVVQLVQREFHHDRGKAPLPVFCRGAKTVSDGLREGLRPDAFPDELHNAQVEDGFFLVVIDDARDSSLPLEEFRKFVQTARDGNVRLLVSTRPHTGWEAAFRETRRGVEIEPQRLDESNIDAFIFRYSRDHGTALDATTRDACRDKQDGTYLPVLVRMALLGNKRGARSIGEIYADVADALLGDETDARRQAAWELCRVTYWKDGVRAIARNLSQYEEKIRWLCAAGMLVSNGPKEVRFFHDSMQSFLTAEALWKLESHPLTLLARAAGDTQFSAATKDGRGSELFRFCVEVFSPRERIITQLANDLTSWAKTHGGDLAENQITAATPPAIFGTGPVGLTSEKLLLHLVQTAQALPTDEAQLNTLTALYAALAPLVWHFAQIRIAGSLAES